MKVFDNYKTLIGAKNLKKIEKKIDNGDINIEVKDDETGDSLLHFLLKQRSRPGFDTDWHDQIIVKLLTTYNLDLDVANHEGDSLVKTALDYADPADLADPSTSKTWAIVGHLFSEGAPKWFALNLELDKKDFEDDADYVYACRMDGPTLLNILPTYSHPKGDIEFTDAQCAAILKMLEYNYATNFAFSVSDEQDTTLMERFLKKGYVKSLNMLEGSLATTDYLELLAKLVHWHNDCAEGRSETALPATWKEMLRTLITGLVATQVDEYERKILASSSVLLKEPKWSNIPYWACELYREQRKLAFPKVLVDDEAQDTQINQPIQNQEQDQQEEQEQNQQEEQEQDQQEEQQQKQSAPLQFSFKNYKTMNTKTPIHRIFLDLDDLADYKMVDLSSLKSVKNRRN